MGILILNGSSRSTGNTSKIVQYLEEKLGNEVEVINTCEVDNIGFCKSCDYCKNNLSCKLEDDGEAIFDKIVSSKFLIIATPIYFESFPASLKLIIDRLQPIYYNSIGDSDLKDYKKCYSILIAGQDRKGQFDHVSKILNVIYKQLNGAMAEELLIGNTDKSSIDINNYKNVLDKIINEIKEV